MEFGSKLSVFCILRLQEVLEDEKEPKEVFQTLNQEVGHLLASVEQGQGKLDGLWAAYGLA